MTREPEQALPSEIEIRKRRHEIDHEAAGHYFTVTVPTICGWIEQTYRYVPGLENLKLNVSF